MGSSHSKKRAGDPEYVDFLQRLERQHARQLQERKSRFDSRSSDGSHHGGSRSTSTWSYRSMRRRHRQEQDLEEQLRRQFAPSPLPPTPSEAPEAPRTGTAKPRALVEHSELFPDEEAEFWQVLWATLPDENAPAIDGPEPLHAKRWKHFKDLSDRMARVPDALLAMRAQAERMAGELEALEADARVLFQLAQSGYYLDLIYRFDQLLDALFAAFDIPALTAPQELMIRERIGRLKRFRELLDDPERLRAELDTEDGEDQSFELLTLLKHNFMTYTDRLARSELQLLTVAFQRISEISGVVVMTLPHWFRPALELDAHYNVRYNEKGKQLRTVTVLEDEDEESMLIRMDLMARRGRGYDIGVTAASHIGKHAYLHQPVEAVNAIKLLRLPTAEKWRYLFQITQAILSLHDRGLVIGNFSWDHVELCAPDRALKLNSIRSCCPLLGPNATARDKAIVDHMWPSTAREEPSTAWDVYCLGKCIFELLVEANDPGRPIIIQYGKPLPRRPAYIRESTYWLIEALCKPAAAKRPTAANVLRSLYWLMTEEAVILRPLTSVKETVAGVDAINCAPFDTHMAGVLRQCLQLVGRTTVPGALARREMNMHLYTRCWAIHGLLVKHGTLPKKPVEKLGRRIVEFNALLQSCAEPNTGDIYDFVAYYAQIQVYVDLHRGIDDCLAEFGPVIQRPGEPEPPTVYQWQSRWAQLHQKQRAILMGGLEKASTALENELMNPRGVQSAAGLDLAETHAMLQFELSKRRHRYAVEELELMTKVASNLLKVIRLTGLETWSPFPEWFIPMYELNCVPALCTARPGQEITGKWRGRSVLVRVSHEEETSSDVADTIETFYQLKHPNVYTCYGGCYGGTHGRYIVWDKPGTSLDKLTHGKKKPTAATWTQLLDTALGIQFLHTANVGVCDLTASAINVTADGRAQVTIKDGLTPRWAAPELLNDDAPTVASDIYAFGMVVLEALSGEIPWSTDLSEEKIVQQVREGKLPPQPANVTRDGWTLVRRLCALDPTDRVGMQVAIAAIMHAQRQASELEMIV